MGSNESFCSSAARSLTVTSATMAWYLYGIIVIRVKIQCLGSTLLERQTLWQADKHTTCQLHAIGCSWIGKDEPCWSPLNTCASHAKHQRGNLCTAYLISSRRLCSFALRASNSGLRILGGGEGKESWLPRHISWRSRVPAPLLASSGCIRLRILVGDTKACIKGGADSFGGSQCTVERACMAARVLHLSSVTTAFRVTHLMDSEELQASNRPRVSCGHRKVGDVRWWG